MKCRICGNDRDLRPYVAREMMFGLREEFTYLLCPSCGCLQLDTPPADMAKHYPPSYYSLENEDAQPALVKWLTRQRDRYAFEGRGLIGRWMNGLLANGALTSVRRVAHDREIRILDVGCGSGTLLKSLRRLGFKRLQGADPYNREDLKFDDIEIRKAHLRELTGEWDVIMLHHVFEHLPDPLETLVQIRERLTKDGTCIIRIPVVSSWAWEHYGVNWVDLDAPRHFFLHSLESMNRLAAGAGLRITETVFDSSGFQFWGSELYQRDIALQDARNVRYFLKLFPLKTLRAYAQRAKELNAQGKGDQAAFYLKKAA